MRKLLLLTIIFCGLFSFTSCTSKNDMALDAAKNKIHTDFKLESENALNDKPILFKKYLSTIEEKSEYEVIKKEDISDSEILVTIKAKLVPDSARQSLKEIFAKQSDSHEVGFNGSNALALVMKQLNLTKENYSDKTLTVKLKKTDSWQVISVK